MSRANPRRGVFQVVRDLVIGCLGLGLFLLAPSEASPPGATTVIVPAQLDTDLSPDATAFRATVAGQDVAVLSVRPVDSWNVVVAVDAPLSTPDGLRAAIDLLSGQIEALVALGPVRLLSIDSGVREIIAPTQDPDALRRALADLTERTPAGELLANRRASSPTDDELVRLDAAVAEIELLRWQREPLVDWLVTADLEGPKALFLVQDGIDFQTERAYGLRPGELAGTPSPVFDDRILGVALAASGWTAHPLLPAAGTATVDRQQVGRPLATETGGRLVSSAGDLTAAIERLTSAIAVDLAVGVLPSDPLPIELVAPTLEISPPRWLSTAFVPGRAAARARRYLAGGEAGDIPVSAALLYDGPDETSVMIEVSATLDSRHAPPTSAALSLALYLDQLGAAPLEIEIQGRDLSLAGIDRWVAQCALVLPEDPGEMVAVITDASGDRWGAVAVEDEGDHLTRRAPGLTIEQFDLRPQRAAKQLETTPDTAIRLLAPSGDRLSGRQRFQTLVTSGRVSRVVFFLDDRQVAEDTKAPFGTHLDLGRAATRHTVRVEAYDAARRLVGSDSIRLNEPMRSFDVSIVSVESASGGRLQVEAAVSHPTDVAVERLEFYYNERLVSEIASPPWTAEVDPQGEIGMTDYVRVVAYLDDARFLEDVRLLASPGASESVEVNLVQLYVVATQRDGQTVTDLTADDFEILLGGQSQQILRFAFADEVSLLLGLVIDTSPSMWALMPDTKKAAARFLTQVISDRDRALVIDFDTRPRLAAQLTDDITDLLLSLGSMIAEPQGTTALYDSVIFGALQLPAGQDRKALVLLTDGDDYKSRFGAPRAIDTAKRAGVPVYIVSLAGLHDARRQLRRLELDALTEQTGGEAYYLGAMEELGPTYDRIANELRSQYLLAFSTDRQLSEKDLESIRVKVKRPGLELRTVVGGRSIN